MWKLRRMGELQVGTAGPPTATIGPLAQTEKPTASSRSRQTDGGRRCCHILSFGIGGCRQVSSYSHLYPDLDNCGHSHPLQAVGMRASSRCLGSVRISLWLESQAYSPGPQVRKTARLGHSQFLCVLRKSRPPANQCSRKGSMEVSCDKPFRDEATISGSTSVLGGEQYSRSLKKQKEIKECCD